MNPVFFTIERRRWSIHLQRETTFRLTYREVWIPERNTWADYLVNAEEIS